MRVIETERLLIRWLTADDAPFILELLNEPSWLRYIGDKGVKTLEDARNYIEKGPCNMYRRLGFGLYLVALKRTGDSIGICGLIKRETLEDVDVGFAFLQRFAGQGYAFESASAVLSYGRRDFDLSRIVAISSPDNEASAKLLQKLGFNFERVTRLTPEASEVKLYVQAESQSHPLARLSGATGRLPVKKF